MEPSNTPNESPGYEPPTSAKELIERYAAGERCFRDADIPDGACFKGVVLVGAILEQAWLFDADFRGADLRDVIFDRSNVKCADFSDADLRGASFTEAVVDGAIFTGAELGGVSFEAAGSYGYRIHNGDGFPNST
jgi:uncharacterized protein YjbI with pentapeptide repeats